MLSICDHISFMEKGTLSMWLRNLRWTDYPGHQSSSNVTIGVLEGRQQELRDMGWRSDSERPHQTMLLAMKIEE